MKSLQLLGIVFSLGFFLLPRIFATEVAIPVQWKNIENSTAFSDGGTALLNFRSKNGKGGWLSGRTVEPVPLAGRHYLEFEFRTADGRSGICNLFFCREITAEDRTSYNCFFPVTPTWKKIRMPLIRGSVSEARSGKAFSFSRGSRQCTVNLNGQGKIVSLGIGAPRGYEESRCEIRNICLTSEEGRSPAVEALIKSAMSVPSCPPYQFNRILPGKGVPAVNFSIVIPENASETVCFAAQELSRYLSEVTESAFSIHRGASASSRQIQLSVVPRQPSEGFTSSMKDGKLLRITGNSERGLLYGVYDFLETAAGCRWFSPYDFGEVIPKNRNLEFQNFEHQDAPKIDLFRFAHYCSDPRDRNHEPHIWNMADWCVKNRTNTELTRLTVNRKSCNQLKYRHYKDEFYRKRGGVSLFPRESSDFFFHGLIPLGKYADKHPEYFGYEKSSGTWRTDRTQICTTNPEVIEIIADKARKYFLENPREHFFPMWQEDGSRLWCQCPRCLALTPYGDNSYSVTEANVYLGNAVLKKIREEFPDKEVMIFAYSVTSVPSAEIKPMPGVWVVFCSLKKYDQLQEWARQTNGCTMVYTYNYLTPMYTMNERISEYEEMFRVMAILNIRGVKMETSPTWYGGNGVYLYVSARLAWNPYLDLKALLEDYFSGYFGKNCGAIMKEYCRNLENDLKNPLNVLEGGTSVFFYLTPERLRYYEDQLARARQAAGKNARVLKLLDHEMLYLNYLEQHSQLVSLVHVFYSSPDRQRFETAVEALKKIRIFIMSHGEKYGVWPARNYMPRLERKMKMELENSEKNSRMERKYQSVMKLVNWKFLTDENNAGEKQKWFSEQVDDSQWKTIQAGKFWDKQGYQYCGYAYYRMKIKLNKGNKYILHFGGVDERAWIYLNGHLIGAHADGNISRLWQESFTINLPDDFVRNGENQITVKVHNSIAVGGIYRPVELLRKK